MSFHLFFKYNNKKNHSTETLQINLHELSSSKSYNLFNSQSHIHSFEKMKQAADAPFLKSFWIHPLYQLFTVQYKQMINLFWCDAQVNTCGSFWWCWHLFKRKIRRPQAINMWWRDEKETESTKCSQWCYNVYVGFFIITIKLGHLSM